MVFHWIEENQAVVWWLGMGSAVMFVGTLIVLPVLVVRIPSEYFLSERPPQASWRARHPILRGTILVLKNVLGLVCLLIGLVMLITPGQGILMVLIAVTLLNFPGKRALELWIVRRPAVVSMINWMRGKANREPLRVPESE